VEYPGADNIKNLSPGYSGRKGIVPENFKTGTITGV